MEGRENRGDKDRADTAKSSMGAEQSYLHFKSEVIPKIHDSLFTSVDIGELIQHLRTQQNK